MYSNSFYGDDVRWFIGRVVDNNDPLRLGRLRVRIYGIHSGSTEHIPEYALPWAQVVIPVTEEGSTGYGSNPAILPSAQVFGIFLDGKDSQLPLVIGSIPKIESDKAEDDQYTNPTDDQLPGQSNAEKIFLYLISDDQHAYTPEQACGMLGNLKHESNLNPLQVSDVPGEDSYGIAQWNPAPGVKRKQELIEYCTTNGYDYTSLFGQLKWLKADLDKNNFRRVDTKLGDLKDARTVEIASKIFEFKYEVPQAGSTDARIEHALKYYETFVTGTPS